MLLPKLPTQQKQKLILNQKTFSQPNSHQFQPFVKKQEKQSFFGRTLKVQESHIKKMRSFSSISKQVVKISSTSLRSKQISLNQKQNQECLKNRKIHANIIEKPLLRLSLKIQKYDHLKDLQISGFSRQSSDESQKQIYQKKDQIIEDENNNSINSQANQNSLHQKNLNSENQNNAQKELQNESLFQDVTNTKIFTLKTENLRKNTQRNTISRHSRKYSRLIIKNDLTLNCSVFSLKIRGQNTIKPVSSKKQEMIEQLVNDAQFQWKYGKYKQYALKYTECEVKLKQKISILEFLSQNLELLKQRVTPFKSIQSLQEIVQIIKPTMTKKQQNAFQIKMQMLEWKKKFFTNASKIRSNFNRAIEKKYEIVFERLGQNESMINSAMGILEYSKKRETVIQENHQINRLENLLSAILLNQKQMIDQIRICERDDEALLEKFNLIEEQWSNTIDIFNSTLENCVNKCLFLSDTIQKFYGKCSTAMFLTKGMDVANRQDIKMIQNDKCYICRWNEIKLKKIIEENCLAKDHLQALKHLIAN